jgi:hypothetical protein
MTTATWRWPAAGLLAALLVCGAARFASGGAVEEPENFFRQYVGLNDGEISSIHQGKPVAKIMDAPDADQVFVFGGVRIEAAPESYLKFAADLDRLRQLPGFLAIKKFSDPPVLADLDGFTLEDEDVKQMKDCHPGKCEVQLPAGVMDEFQKQVDWSSPNAADQANHLAQQIALKALQAYISGGNQELGTYRDKSHPAEVAETFQALINRSKALPVYLPDLRQYLLDYPSAKADNIKSQFYWEKVNFGLKPTLRMVQAVVYQGSGANQGAYAVAVKQLYSSHYFESALDLTVCVPDRQAKKQPAFYLITLKGSQQAGLTGFKGGIVRKVAVDRSRSSLQKSLVAIKMQLESGSQ